MLQLGCLSLDNIILGFSVIGPLMSKQLLSFETMFEKSLPLVLMIHFIIQFTDKQCAGKPKACKGYKSTISTLYFGSGNFGKFDDLL